LLFSLCGHCKLGVAVGKDVTVIRRATSGTAKLRVPANPECTPINPIHR
jgi:hypothetical protein